MTKISPLQTTDEGLMTDALLKGQKLLKAENEN
jgi:hypothetical protein